MGPNPSDMNRAAATSTEAESPRTTLDDIEAPAVSASVALASGRRYDLDAGRDADRVTIRARSGEVVLQIEVTDAGPVLRFSGASVELSAARRLHLAAREVSVEAEDDLSLSAGGTLREHAGRDHHARVAGDARIEAANVELQASTGGVGVRALGRIALDGEHIGLNDDPAPQPFPWSEIVNGRTEPEPSYDEAERLRGSKRSERCDRNLEGVAHDANDQLRR